MGKEEQSMGIIINNVTTVDEEGRIGDINLRIENGEISAIAESPFIASPQDTLIDGRGKLAIPGMVNAHTHLPMSLFRGMADDLPLDTWLRDHIWPAEAELDDDDVYWGSLLSLAEMIRSGTTQVADMYFHTDSVAAAVSDA
jgi:5-methylthioadenosine/S-adenosylhomocysteine deaminase